MNELEAEERRADREREAEERRAEREERKAEREMELKRMELEQAKLAFEMSMIETRAMVTDPCDGKSLKTGTKSRGKGG